MEHIANDHKDHPNQCDNSQKLNDEMSIPFLSLTESQWKLRKHDQSFCIEGKSLQNKYKHQKKGRN